MGLSRDTESIEDGGTSEVDDVSQAEGNEQMKVEKVR
jgi:hypothetical protein